MILFARAKKLFYLCAVAILLLAGETFAQDTTDYYTLAQKGSVAEFKAAFKKNKSLNTQVFGENRETLLMLCLRENRDKEIITFLLKQKCSPTASAKNGCTPVMLAAAYSSHPDVLDALIKNGLILASKKKKRVLAEDSNGRNAFDYALINPVQGIKSVLKKYAPAGIPSKPEDVLDEHKAEAAVEEEQDIPSTTEDDIPRVNRSQEQETTGSQTKTTKITTVTTVTEVTAAPAPAPTETESAFLYDFVHDKPSSTLSDSPLKPEMFVETPNATDENGVTLLMKAAKAGNDWDVRLLLQSGADVQRRDNDGWTALMYAVRYQNNLSIVNELINGGAFVRVRDHFNTTPLLLAAGYSQNPDIVAKLLEGRSTSDNEVFKAFILAIMSEEGSEHVQKAKIQLFIDLGVPVNLLWKGKTPLMYACEYGTSLNAVALLLEAGAKPSIRDNNGNTAFDYAKQNASLEHNDTYWQLNVSSAR